MLVYQGRNDAFLGSATFANKMIAEYHAEVHDDDKSRILTEFKKPTSTIRCLITTVAFGMGIDIPDIRLVCHWGESNTVAEYWQEVGRAGRDGQPAEAILYHRQIQLNRCEKDMKEFIGSVSSGMCIRKQVLAHMHVCGMPVANIEREGCKCSCCSTCRNECSLCMAIGDVSVNK